MTSWSDTSAGSRMPRRWPMPRCESMDDSQAQRWTGQPVAINWRQRGGITRSGDVVAPSGTAAPEGGSVTAATTAANTYQLTPEEKREALKRAEALRQKLAQELEAARKAAK